MENKMKYIKSNLKMNGFPKKTVEKQIQNLNGNTLLVILDKKVVMMIKSTSKFHTSKESVNVYRGLWNHMTLPSVTILPIQSLRN